MPIKIPDSLPASRILENENVFVMTEYRALHQDIRPLKIVILNLMPKKIETETQLLRLLGNSPIQVDIELMQTKSHTSKNTPSEHLFKFYKTFDDLRGQRFDGMIITGAPVEQMAFEEVEYWDELCEIMEWSKQNVYSTLHICWGAQAGLYYHYGVNKYPLDEKLFGIFQHRLLVENHSITRGFDELFYVPHSRHTTVSRREIDRCPELEILASSKEAGVYMVGLRVRPRHPLAGILPRPGEGTAHPHPGKLLPPQRPQAEAALHLAGAREPALLQLAQLLRLPDDPLRSRGARRKYPSDCIMPRKAVKNPSNESWGDFS